MLRSFAVYGMAGITLFAIAMICFHKYNNYWLLLLKVTLLIAVVAFGITILALVLIGTLNLPYWYYPVYRVWLPAVAIAAFMIALEGAVGFGMRPRERGCDPSHGEDPGLKCV